MTLIYANASEQTHHLKAMEEIAQELGADFNTVRETYEHELDRLQAGAKLRDYLPLLAARRAKELLHRAR